MTYLGKVKNGIAKGTNETILP